MDACAVFQEEIKKAAVEPIRMPALSKAIVKAIRVLFLKKRKKVVAQEVADAVVASIRKKKQKRKS